MKVGLLIPRSGPAGIWAPSCEACAMLAAAEINVAGGLFGRQLDLVVRDIGWTEGEAVEAANAMVSIDGVDAVVAMHPSNTREAIEATIASRVPYIYTPQYEDQGPGDRAIKIGPTDGEVLRPTIRWLIERRKAHRFFIVGSDYVWAQMSKATARDVIRGEGADVVGAALTPLGTSDYTMVLDAIRRTQPHVVLMFLLGLDAIRFNRAFAAAGLGAGISRLGMACDETIICAIGPDNLDNFYSAADYFSVVRSLENESFLERYHDGFGERAPPANAGSRSCYAGIHTVAHIARRAGSDDPASMQHAVGRQPRRPGRALRPDRREARRIYLAAAEGVDFKLLATF